MSSSHWPPKKPKALAPASKIAIVAPASPAEALELIAGVAELTSLGFQVISCPELPSEGYFAGATEVRRDAFLEAMKAHNVDGLIALRGGYGSNYLLNFELDKSLSAAKCVIGFSDITSLQIYLWQRCGWVTFYGPMVAAGLNRGADTNNGYDEASFRNAIGKTDGGWKLPLRGESLAPGEAEGRLLGGCLTILEATLGTPWEIETRDAILVLEDRAMKPYQVDRVLMHLKQARKLAGVKGFVLGDFPECAPSVVGSPTVRDVCVRILGALRVPIVFGAPVGHTPRPMLTLPLGVRARLRAQGEGLLEILEPAVVP